MALGKKTGGRQKGSRNRASAARETAIAASGLTPLAYMLSVMRDPENPRDVRLDAANKVAPYVHPRLAAIEHTGANGGPIQTEEVGARDRITGRIARIIERSAKGVGSS